MNPKDDILADAIRVAIEASRDNIRLKRALLVSIVVNIFLILVALW